MYLTVTNDAQTTILHPDGLVVGCTYFPTTGDGQRVTESAILVLEGTDAAVRARINALELLLASAEQQVGLLLPKHYANFRATDSGDIRRSELISGFVRWSEEPIRRRLQDATVSAEALVTWTRVDFWEGPESEVPISSASQSERTGGVDIYNKSPTTPTQTNYLQAAASRVAGMLPAPVRIRLTNAAGVDLSSRAFYLANNVFGNPTSLSPFLLGSASAGGATVSWSAGVTHGSLTYVWTIDDTTLGYLAGRRFRVMAGFTSISAGAWLRAGAYSVIGGVYAPLRVTAERKTDGYELFDLGSLPLPPGGYQVSNTALALALTVRHASAGAATLSFVQLFATDSVRRLMQNGYSIPVGAGIEDNGIDGGAYYVSGASRYPIVRAYGPALQVWPGRTQRIHVLFDEGSNFVISRKMTAQLWYRPRYRTV